MILVDTALAKREAEGRPIRVGLVGAGFMGSGVALQIAQYTKGMRLCAISARRVDQGLAAFAQAGVEDVVVCETRAAIETAIAAGKHVVTPDHKALAGADGLDIVTEMTGSIDTGAEAALEAIAAGRPFVHMNAELCGTLGPLLKAKADRAGVIYSFSDGDQPGVEMNLFRFVKGLGVRPVLCGNIKGLHDPYRNPTTQESFAKKWGQKPAMVASFADGTKISFEQAIVANGTGMRVARRGMYGPDFSGGDPYAPLTPLEETTKVFEGKIDLDGPGIVDYVVGARPGPGVFVLGVMDHPRQQHYLNLYKLGQGPLYCFYTPYHLCHFETPTSLARAVLLDDAVLAPAGRPQVGVLAAAKRDLKAGETIDELGGYMTYGLAENYDVIARDRLLPIGLAEGCTLVRDVAKDEALTFSDVTRPADRLIDRLYAEQEAMFA